MQRSPPRACALVLLACTTEQCRERLAKCSFPRAAMLLEHLGADFLRDICVLRKSVSVL